MFSILKQRTLAIYRFLNHHKPRLGAFIFVSVLFLAVYLSVGIYSSSTGNLNIFAPHAALAQATGEQDQMMGTLMTWIITLLLATATLMIKIAIFCLHFIIQIGGYNNYLNSTAVNVGWVMVRDVTNMFFVVILLLVAFGTILGLEQYEWKKMLVKFFFAAVLVNFSRIICGVIIDISQVIMITFVNGIAATAGGNLINAFGLNKIMGLGNGLSPDKFKSSDFFIASIGAVIFSSMVMAMMVAFLFILLSRMIVLWILIVLSPFAFVLSVIPETQKYASQWWSEFGNHVVIGPAIAFFLWLAFAVVGGGQINNEVVEGSTIKQTVSTLDSAGIGEAMDWNSMSNFAIALGILMVGAKTSQSLGTVGGSAMGKATDMGKKIAMVATGAGAALWAGKGIAHGAKETGKWAAMNVPLVGGKSWIRRGQNIKSGVEARLEKIGSWRNEGAKKLEESSKKIIQAEEAEKQKLGVRTLTKEQKRGVREKLAAAGEIDDSLQGGVGRFVKRKLASAWETGSRTDKKVKDRQDIVEALKKIKEANFSTSGTPDGIEKQYQQARAAEEEKRGAEKKREKMGAAQAGIVREGLTDMRKAKEALANASSPKEEAAAKEAIKKAEGHVSMVTAKTKVKADISVSGYTTLSQDLLNDVQASKMGDEAARARLRETTSTNNGDATRFKNDLGVLMMGGKDVKNFVDAYVKREEFSHSTGDARSELVAGSMTDHSLHTAHLIAPEHTKAALVAASGGESLSGLDVASQAEAARLGQVITAAEGEQAVLSAALESLSAAINSLSATSVQGKIARQYELTGSIESGEENLAKLKTDFVSATTDEEKIRISGDIAKQEDSLKADQTELENIPNDLQRLSPGDEKQIDLLEKLLKATTTSDSSEKKGLIDAINGIDFADSRKAVFGNDSAINNNTVVAVQSDKKESVRKMLESMKDSKKIKEKEIEKKKATEGVEKQSEAITNAIIKGMEIRVRGIAKTDPAMAKAYFQAKKDRATNLQSTAQGRLDEQVANKVIWDQRGFRDLGETANSAAVSKVSARFKGIDREQLVQMFAASSKIIGDKWAGEEKNKGSYSEKSQLEDQMDALGLLSAIRDGGYADDATVNLSTIMETNVSSKDDNMKRFFSTVENNYKKIQNSIKPNFSPSIKVNALADSGSGRKDAFKIILNKVASKVGPDIDAKSMLDILAKGPDRDVDVAKHIADLIQNDGEARDKLREVEITTEQLMGILKHLSLDITNRNKLNV